MRLFRGRLVKRTWGWYLTLLDRKHFKVKILRFHKNKKMSTQYHKQRNELWLFPKDGAYRLIPAGTLHTFCASENCWVLEIQYGERCIEEDIVRI